MDLFPNATSKAHRWGYNVLRCETLSQHFKEQDKFVNSSLLENLRRLTLRQSHMNEGDRRQLTASNFMKYEGCVILI